MSTAPARGYQWLASYPKSGNTWLRLALASLSRDGAPPDFTASIDFAGMATRRVAFDLLLDVDSSDLTRDEVERLRPRFYEVEARRHAEPQLRKVHDAWTRTASGEPLFPPALTLAAIYIVRDPRDVAVSFTHHGGAELDRTIAGMGGSDAALADGRRRGGPQLPQRLLTWSAHVRSWLEAPVPPLLLRYEDMLADPAAALIRAARHLGWEAPADAVARAVEATRFETLRAAEDRHGFGERPLSAERFFRRGVAGGWREVLSPAQVARIEADHGGVMAELGYL